MSATRRPCEEAVQVFQAPPELRGVAPARRRVVLQEIPADLLVPDLVGAHGHRLARGRGPRAHGQEPLGLRWRRLPVAGDAGALAHGPAVHVVLRPPDLATAIQVPTRRLLSARCSCARRARRSWIPSSLLGWPAVLVRATSRKRDLLFSAIGWYRARTRVGTVPPRRAEDLPVDLLCV
jgi:hypothetical protein